MRTTASFCLALLLILCAAPTARAGGSPETTLIVVNEDSPTSWAVANAYAKLRGIPATHICPIPAPPHLLVIKINDFRQRIWHPIQAYIKRHGLEEEIDCITYSADFPFCVNYGEDFDVSKLAKILKPTVASLTGMTYLQRHVMARSKEYLGLTTNQYLRVDGDGEVLPGHGFRHAYEWGRDIDAEKKPDDSETPDRYYLSTMLGHTGMQGNTVPEILAYLGAAAKADGTSPKGTVYLMVNRDVRSQTRKGQFEDTEKALKRLGAKVERLELGKDGQDGKAPKDKKDVMGCVAGIAGFNWPACGSTLMPGSIAEHLTSFGARFDGSGQTKISEYLRAGAAGSSGAVAEPYALWQKFPLATLHVHYREGCSLAESFYQSVAGPYQLLVIGDPLARPYAKFATLDLQPPEAYTGTVALTAKAKAAKKTKLRSLEWWLDGQRLGETKPGAAFAFDTTKAADGMHELRVVAVEDSRIETRTARAYDITVANGTHTVTIKTPKKATAWGETLKITGKASGAKEVVVMSGHRVLAKAKRIGSSIWKAEFDARLLGEGVTRVQAKALDKDGTYTLSPFADVEVGPPAAGSGKKKQKKRKKKRRAKKGKAAKAAKNNDKHGLRVTAVDARGKDHIFTTTIVGSKGKQRFLNELRRQMKGNPKSIDMGGMIQASVDGTYRLAINAAGSLTIKVAGRTVFEGSDLDPHKQAYAAVSLTAGWHDIEIDYTPSGNGDISVWLGGAVVSAPLMKGTIRY